MRFSVVTVALNAAKTIGDTLKSVGAQDYAQLEHVIVDGGSADGTLEEIERYRHPRLSMLTEPDEGLYDAMNKGLRLAKGEFVIFLNANDYFCRADALSLVSRHIEANPTDCVFANTRFVREDGVTPARRVYSANHFRPWWLRVGAMPPHPSMFVRRDLLLDAGGFDLRYRIAADFDLIARLLLKRRASWTTLPVTITNFRTGGLSTAGLGAKRTLSREMAQSLKNLGQPLSKLAVQCRLPLKLTQYRLTRAQRAEGASLVGR